MNQNKILLVGDSPSSRQKIAQYLRSKGHTVIEVRNGLVALKLCFRTRYAHRSLTENPSPLPFRAIICCRDSGRLDGPTVIREVHRLWKQMRTILYTERAFENKKLFNAAKSCRATSWLAIPNVCSAQHMQLFYDMIYPIIEPYP